jgi:RND family efflux transporter MFP subunit
VTRSLVAVLSAVAAFAASAGCDRKPTASAPPKPAAVTAPVKEAELTTVRLTEDAERRLGIVTVPAERRAVARTRVLGGEVLPPSGTAVAIAAPVAGTLEAPDGVPAPGAAVSRGQLLFRIVPLAASERESTVLAQQSIDAALAKRDAAKRRADRADQLLKDGAGSRRQLEDAQAELALADAELKGARDRAAAAGRSGVSAAGMRIDAPQAGIVQAVHVKAGQAVAAAAPLLDLVQTANVWVRVAVYAGEAKDIDPREPARVLMLSDPPDAPGVIAQPIPAPPSANATAASVDFFYALSNPSRQLRPGERVAVRLTRRDTASGLVVPAAALLHDAYGGTWVYVQREPHVYARVRVVVADIVGSSALLSQGPAVNARVVTDGAAELFGVEFGAGK